MLLSLAILMSFQLIGLVVVTMFSIPVPAPVMGMLLLIIALLFYPPLLERTRQSANVFLAHLALFFVPAGVGLIEHVERIQGEALAISVSLLVSTVLGMIVTALTIRWMKRWLESSEEKTK